MLDWQIAQDDDWEAFESPAGAFETEKKQKRTGEQGRRRRLLGLLLIGLLAALTVSYRGWQVYQDSTAHIQADIQRTVDQEAWAWYNHDGALADGLMDDQARERWTRGFRRLQYWRLENAGQDAQLPEVEVQNVEMRGDLALVDVIATQPATPWPSMPYRESRFYRQAENRWLRTAPDPSFWGPQRTLETDYFHVEFRQRDAEAVEAAASEIDALYTALRRDVGLGPAPAYAALRRDVGLGSVPAGEKLTIKIAVDVVPLIDATGCYPASDSLIVAPTPALMRVPVELSSAAALQDTLRCSLVRQVLNEAREQHSVKPTWSELLRGLELWLSWDGSAVPSARRHTMEEELRQTLAVAPLSLTELNSQSIPRGLSATIKPIGAVTLIDYAVTTYGRERLPALLRGLTKYETWEALIPAVFGVPAEEFEAGWQRHLTTHYAPQNEL